MLAVKAHQLRALIHRPFLCLRWLQRDNLPLVDLLGAHRDDIGRAERICVLEAQQTARLLHNVEDERSLIHDFPWWQMVSCLICASSILLIADSFLQDGDTSAELQQQDFRKDAENCLKVFEALSVNTEAARRARAMLARVTERKRTTGKAFLPIHRQLLKFVIDSSHRPEQLQLPSTGTPMANVPSLGPLSANLTIDSAPAIPLDSCDNAYSVDWWSQWPEISNTMAWSTQFFDSTVNLAESDLGLPNTNNGVYDG